MPKRGLITAGLAALALGGCAVGPNFHTPAPPSVSGYTREPLPATTGAADVAGDAQTFVQNRDLPGQWWTLYQSPALNALVERALKANPDMKAAQAALRAARETYYAQRAALWPTVSAGYNIQRQQANGTLAPPLASNNDLFTLNTAQLSIAYTADVFGGLRRQTESVRAQAEAQRFQTEGVYLTLITNVVNTAIQVAMLRDQVAATRAIIESDSEVLEIMRRQFAFGEIGRGDVVAQEAALAQAKQTLPPLEKQLALAEDLIADLTGRFPSETPADEISLASLTLPADLPISLPSTVVRQRPDIRAAQANLHAASAQVGVAEAARWPSLQIEANAGSAALRLAPQFNTVSNFWSVAATLTQPIFEGGTLLHRQRAAEAAYDQAAQQYQATVVGAFQNTADVLHALWTDADALRANEAAAEAADASLDIARRQLGLGDLSRLAVLSAEQTDAQARLALLQARANRYADAAALFQALGGGWWNDAAARPAAKPAP